MRNMGIKVAADDSIEGRVIKKFFENENVQKAIKNSLVIRWGNWWDDVYGKVTLNSPQSIKNTLNKENMIMTLRKSHVKCPKKIRPGRNTDFPIIGRKYRHQNGEDIKIIDSFNECINCDCDYFIQYLNIIEEYHVHVMDLKVFFIEEKYPACAASLDEPVIRSSNFGWVLRRADLSGREEDEVKEIQELAIKAVYSLGLDFGVVNLAKTFDEKYYVLDIDAVCKCMSKECEEAYIAQFAETLSRYDNLICDTEDTTIGADIECVIKDKETNALVYASDFFEKDGPIGLDNRSIEAGRKYFPLLEIRPDYSNNPVEVINSIQQIMNRISEHICYENLGIYAGSMPVYNYWVGGHIHFGIKPNSKLLRALDNYLALPVMMVEMSSFSRGRKTKYGQLGDFRIKSHGGFEYRTLSSWIINPEIARAILCLAKVIVREYLNLKGEFLNSFYDIRAYYSSNKVCFIQRMEDIICDIEKTATFKSYSSYIEPFFKKVMSLEEWDENKPINGAWNMPLNGRIFKPSARCYIPKKKRAEIGVELEEMVEVVIGRKKYRLNVYPKDEYYIDEDKDVSFSGDVCNEIGIEESDCIKLWFNPRFKILKAGPVLGILSDIEECECGPFGNQSYYFRKLIKFSKSKGMIAFVFAIYGAEWDKGRVNGYTYNFSENKWEARYFPIPDVIYDRGDVVNKENYGHFAEDLIAAADRMGIKFINSFGCINTMNDKWITYILLNSSSKIKTHQPQTFLYRCDRQIIESIIRYGHIFIKLRHGSMGKGIFSVKRLGNNIFEVIYSDKERNIKKFSADKRNLLGIIKRGIAKFGCQRTDFIIQRAIQLAKYKNNKFEIRVVMQKNSKGLWLRTCMVARCWGEDGGFINAESESNESAAAVLEESFGSNADLVAHKIREISKDIVSLLDEKKIQAGEIAIDFAVDNKLNIYVIEINSKPDNLLSSVKAFKMRNLAINRILEYARFLVV